MINAIKFSEGATEDKIRRDIENDPEGFLKAKTKEGRFAFGMDNIMQYGSYKEMGYRYDLRSFMKRFVCKHHGHWIEKYAINKTSLRALVGGHIDEIIEAK